MFVSKAKLLFELIMYVNARRQFTARDVAYEFNISLRTVHRYLSELGEMGVPLYTEPGRNGGYRVLDNRVLPPILFSESEAFSIFFAFESLKYYHSLPFDIDIKLVSDKIYSSLPTDTKRKVDQLSSVLTFWNIKRGVPSPYLKEIIEAAVEKQVVHIEYISKSGKSLREVAPIGIYAYNGFWYMPGFDIARREVRLFRTDRIQALSRLNQTYDPEMTLDDWLIRHPEQEPAPPIRLYVELTREGIRQCRSQPWLEPNIVMRNEEQGYIDTTIDRTEIEYVSHYFYRLGTAAKVLEPQEIVNRICVLAEELLQHYT
ncbi:DNA-binding transcriptional regulator [Thermoflavimicrobium daqui]|uniref:DNA-binding transcriptional regulator n=1 Tax=Thermoflavimicrobium daqui TaxID=2137476 RepID=A0A364K231_9BACL|nr:DNA-binding transcriptional regulator [Thermoflavimicrobium daqui]